MFDLDEDGAVTLRNVIHCGGNNPRGLCISPDARFLFAANMNSGQCSDLQNRRRRWPMRAPEREQWLASPGSMKVIEM